MMTLYGVDLLLQIYAAYLDRYQKALQRGYDAEGERYHWLPKFLCGVEDDKALQFVFEYTSRLFSPESIGASDHAEGEKHPFFHDGNPYWRDLQEGMEAFNEEEILKNRPLLYVYSCELITRAIRLYLQIRETKFHAIDREKFHGLMQMQKTALPEKK